MFCDLKCSTQRQLKLEAQNAVFFLLLSSCFLLNAKFTYLSLAASSVYSIFSCQAVHQWVISNQRAVPRVRSKKNNSSVCHLTIISVSEKNIFTQEWDLMILMRNRAFMVNFLHVAAFHQNVLLMWWGEMVDEVMNSTDAF